MDGDASCSDGYCDPAEVEILEHYEINRERHKDERDSIQKKTFTKWVNKHLAKAGCKINDLFVDIRDGFSLITLLEVLTSERLLRENGHTHFHRIQNVQYCLDFLKRKNIKLVNIRPEDIVEGNGKLTLGLIWTIILNFQVSVIKRRHLDERPQSESHSSSQVSEAIHSTDAFSARDALLQWARKVTSGYPRVNVTNFSSSWKDGLAFNAILHRYRPNLIDWNKVSDNSVSNIERLENAFEVAEREFGVDRLLDPQDVDNDHPDEKSIITYVSSLYHALPQLPELSKSNLTDLISRLSRGIGITNEKLDLILNRIEDVESRVDTARPGEIERTVNEIVDDLNALEIPIGGFFEDVEELKSHNHPEANDFYRQVYGLHQRRTAYLDRLTNQLLVRLGVRTEALKKENAARLESIRTTSFSRVQECIEWVRVRLVKLSEMEFLEDLETLEDMFEQHKLDNRDIQDFRQNVDECIARQAEVSAEDTYEYCELLRVLESEYQQLRDLSAGRMLDLDSLIAFVRAAQLELVWVSEREEIEVTRNWSDIKQLDLPMLTNYYKQLLHEMELREKQYNDVHNQGAALLNQGHPAVHVIEVYLRTMQNQWDWLLALSKCLEEHLRDALNLKSFTEEAADAEVWMEEQAIRLETNYNRTDFDLEEGERLLRELDEMKEILNKYHSVLMALTERCATISPLWQRGERISRPIAVTALCDYSDKNVNIKAGDEVTLLDNSDLIKWHVRDLSGAEAVVPSVVFRIPPPDPKLTAYLNRLLQQFERIKKLWEKKHRMVRFNMVLNTMKTIQGWDLDTFNAIDPEQRDAIMRALNDDANKLLAEMDPNDPLALRLKEELRRTNEHFWDLLNASQKSPEPDHSNLFDSQIGDLLRKLEDAWRKLNNNAGKPISRTPAELESVIVDHKLFEDSLQGLDADVANVKELFRQLRNPTPTQRVASDRLNSLWEDLWDLSRMYVERIKVLESVLNGVLEVSDIVRAHEVTLNSFDDLPAALDKLRGHHSHLLEMNMVLQQQQTVVDALNRNVALLRQHVARTRIGQSSHPDVDRVEEEVQQLNVRWENVFAQVSERLKAAERALQTQMVYRSEYDNEMAWLDRVEETISKLRKPEDLRPEQYQQQLDLLVAEYAQLQERTEAIENVNREGGKFIREAKGYDSRMGQFHDSIVGIHGPTIKEEFRRSKPQPKNGAQIVTEELEALNRRFAQLSSLILERRNTMQVLIQNWKRQKQENVTRAATSRQKELSDILLDLTRFQETMYSQHLNFDLCSEKTTKAQNDLQNLMDFLDSWRGQADMKLAEVDKLCVESADLISPEQYALLREKQAQFAVDYSGVLRSMEHTQERLKILAGLLVEFSAKVSSLQSWMTHHASRAASVRERSADLHRLDEARHDGRRLLDEVGQEECRLKAIGALLLKVEQEVDALYEFAPTASNRGINLDGIHTVFDKVNDDFLALRRQCSDLVQFQNKVGNLSHELNEHYRKLDEWFSSVEGGFVQIDRGSRLGAEQKLETLEDLNEQAFDGYKHIDLVDQASKRLLSAFVGLNTYSDLATQHETESAARLKRHEDLLVNIQQAFNNATAQKAADEGVRDAVHDLSSWLEYFESRTRTNRDIALVEDALNQLKRDEQILRMELDSRLALVKDLEHDLQQVANGGAPVWLDSAQEKLATAILRLQRNDVELRGFHDNVIDALNGVHSLNTNGVSISRSCDEILTVLRTMNTRDVQRIEKLGHELNSLEHQMVDMKRTAKVIKDIPNVTGVEAVDTFLETIDGKLYNARKEFDAKIYAQKEIGRLEDEFEFAKQKVSNFLNQSEVEISAFGPISVDHRNLLHQHKHQLMLSEGHKNAMILMDELDAAYMRLDEVENCGLDNKLSAYKKAVVDMTARYNAQSEALKSRTEKIDRIYQKSLGLKSAQDEVRLWISNQYKALSEYDAPTTTDAVQSHSTALDRLSKEKRLEQRRLDDVRLHGRELAGEALLPGEAEQVLDQIRMLSDEWDELCDHIEAMRNRASLSEKCIDGYNAMDKWLTAKSRMLVAMGSPTTDAAIAKTQMGQIEMINVEMDSEGPNLVKLNKTIQSVLESSPNPKLATMMNDLNSRWSAFENELKLKVHNIQQASYLGTEIKSVQKKIMNEIARLESSIEEFGTLPPSDIEARLDELSASKLILNDLDRNIDQIANLISSSLEVEIDSMDINDLRDQVKNTRKKIEEMSRKLHQLMEIAVSFKNEGDEIEKKLDALLELLREAKSEIDEAPPISADSNRLQELVISLTALTCKINEMEVDFPYVRAMLMERLKKSPNDELQSKLQSLSANWNSTINNVKERKAVVTKVFELVRQFDTLEKSLRDTLEQDENELTSLLVSDDNTDIHSKLKTMEKASALRMADVQTLTALSSRINASAPGPDANKLLRNAENFADDCNNLSKRINLAMEGTQRKVELLEKFNRLVEEVRYVLRDAERHVVDLTDADKVVARLTETTRFWSRSQRELILCINELKKVLTPAKAATIDEVLTELSDEFSVLHNQLRSLEMTLDARKDELEKLYEKTNRTKNETGALFMELSELDSVGRSTAELQVQKQQMALIGQQLTDMKIGVCDILNQWEQALSNGLVNQSQSDANRVAMSDISKMIERAQRKLGQRERKIDQAIRELGGIQKNADVLIEELNTIQASEALTSPLILSDPSSQAEKLKLLKANFKAVGAKVDEFVSECKLLIRSSGPESDTSELGTTINRVCDKWSLVSTAVADKEREVDLAVQQLGRYEDAYKSLMNWIEETEELVENQRPPSADSKVAKAQLHAFDVLMKHVEDKDFSVKGFSALISKLVAVLTAEKEVKTLKQRDEEINRRYDDLVVAVHDRQQRLIKAVELAERFAAEIIPLDSWLTQAEKRLSALGKIPTDVEIMEKKLVEQLDLEEEVYQRSEDVNRTLAIVPTLSALVSVEDANSLEAHANQLASRYESISHRIRFTKDLLNEMSATVKDLFADISNLEVWLSDMEKKMKETSEIAIAPDDLNEQSNIVEDLVTAITERDEQISTVIEVGRQLYRQAGGEEALFLQHRIEQIKRRYGDIAVVADEKLALLAKAIPLSERFHDGFDAVMEWIEAIEEDLVQIDGTDFDTQTQLLFSMEEGVSRWRPEVDDLVAVSSQLQALSSSDQAEEIFQSTVEMMRRVNQIADKVARRAERLDVTDKQSRAVFDELNFLVEWLGDARDRVIAAAAPSVDPEFIRSQLRSQLVMNDDVTSNKGRLRELTVEVRKFCRELDDTGNSSSIIAEQCDHAKDLIDEVTALCMDRTEILERALALSQHLTVEFDRLANWLDQVDDELRTAPELTTATPQHQIQEQRGHNSELAAALMAYLPVVEQFRGDVGELKEICVQEDGIKLGELADEIIAKYDDVRKAVETRGRALDSIVDATSGLGERVDNFMQTLQEVFDRLHQNTTFASDLALLKSQIADINAIKEALRYKKSAYAALKESASEFLSSVPSADLPSNCLNKKLAQLSDLWCSLEKELEDRADVLDSVLVKVNHFWNELDELQRVIDDIHIKLESVEPAVGQPKQLQEQQLEMQTIASNMTSIENKLAGLREAAAALSGIIDPEEQIVINSQVDAIHDGWETIARLLAAKNRDLFVAAEEAVSFHNDLTHLLDWLDASDARLAMFPAMETLKVDEVPRILTELHAFKDEMDKKAVIKEQLFYTAFHIANGAPFHQGAAIRHPVSKLNLRWSQLYAALCERENKAERLLLQMGRLSEAADQLISWMGKTAEMLRELSIHTAMPRELEIKRYQLSVISSDVHARESSVAALNAASQRLTSDDQNTDILRKMDEMNKEWKELNKTLQGLADQLDHAKVEAEKIGREAEQWMVWLDDVESQLTTTRPVGGLPETAQIQLDDFLVLKAEVAQNMQAIDAYIDGIRSNIDNGDGNSNSWIERNYTLIRNRWTRVKELSADREKKLQLALEEALSLDLSMRDTAEWLTAAEKRLAAHVPISRLPDVLENQLHENEKWMDEVAVRKRLMAEQQAAGTRLQYCCEKKDSIPIKNGLVSLKHRFEKVSNRTADRCKQITTALDESRAWTKSVEDLMSWLENVDSQILKEQYSTNNIDRLRKRLDLIKHIQEELAIRKQDFDIAYKQGRTVIDRAPRSEVKQISQWNDDLMKRWSGVVEKANGTYMNTEQAILDSSAFDESILELESWIDAEMTAISTADSRLFGDVEFVRLLSEEQKKREVELCAKRVALQTIFFKGKQLSSKIADERNSITEACNRVSEKWSRLEEACRASSKTVDDATIRATNFDVHVHEVLDWLMELESRLAVSNTDLDQAFPIVEDVKVELLNNREKRDSCLQAGREILANCHPKADQTLKYWIRVVENRWKEVEERVFERESNLLQQQQQEKEREETLFELLEFVAQKREELNKVLIEALPQDLENMNQVQQFHDDFDSKLREKQAIVDSIIKHNRRGKRNAAVGKLSDEWKQLWLDSIGYQTALEGQRQMLEEMRRLEGWRWEVWKDHYVEWNDHRKARVTDLFRRIDRTHTGNVPRELFIDGILASKFPTSRLEMNKVADLFDKGDGLISSKEFIDALRFDRIRELKPLTEHEKVNEEIAKQKNACSCCQQFKIEKVADGHYRFGETQIKRMVRILRSTVMVRVGGGWEALDVFLSKHDPCRARGRLNIEMFYKDVAPSNAIDTMRAFTKGRHRSTASRNVTSGPVMKVREKTERSIPMFSQRRDLKENQKDSAFRDPFVECKDSLTSPTSRPESRASGSTLVEKPTRISSIRKL